MLPTEFGRQIKQRADRKLREQRQRQQQEVQEKKTRDAAGDIAKFEQFTK